METTFIIDQPKAETRWKGAISLGSLWQNMAFCQTKKHQYKFVLVSASF
jgi:hypothetical protein